MNIPLRLHILKVFRTNVATAKATGLSASRVSMLVGGLDPRPEEADRLAAALRVSKAVLFGEDRSNFEKFMASQIAKSGQPLTSAEAPAVIKMLQDLALTPEATERERYSIATTVLMLRRAAGLDRIGGTSKAR